MKKILVIGLLLASVTASAWNYDSQTQETIQSVQLRTGATFLKKWNNGLRLGFSEDVRFDVYNSARGASFRNTFTTVSLGYMPIEYVKVETGYTLKTIGPDTTWSAAKKADPNEWMRHRVFMSVTGSYKWDYVKLHLREKVLMEARTDSVNPLEQNKINWQLRSRLGAEFYIPGKPLKPYTWCEVINTLNAPEYQQKNGHQFISSVRAQAGLKWRISRMSSFDFYYRFTYGYDRDINITKNKGYIQLTEQKLYQHAIGVTYNLDW